MVTAPWTEADQGYKDLVSFMESLSSDAPAPALEIRIAPPAVSGPSAGDPQAGCELFHRSCFVCHGDGGKGTDLAPSLVDFSFDPDYIRRRVRTSGPSREDNPDTVYEGLTGGVMPFWGANRLSDPQVEDLVAFLTRRPVPTCVAPPPDPDGNVLRRGVLTRRFHNVGGIVEELDTRKIRIREFTYDGGGIVVKLWLYKDSAGIATGAVIGPDLRRPAPGYQGETLVVEIPSSIPRNDYDAVSVWCVTARADFGHALLAPP
jgi:mono/diheme cytochrome c family protein